MVNPFWTAVNFVSIDDPRVVLIHQMLQRLDLSVTPSVPVKTYTKFIMQMRRIDTVCTQEKFRRGICDGASHLNQTESRGRPQRLSEAVGGLTVGSELL
jgi:hypothetical protein